MPILLSHLDSYLLIDVLRRLDAKALCRLRQTSKWIDEFAERRRFDIAYRRSDSPWSVEFQILDGKTPPLYYIYKKHRFDPSVISYNSASSPLLAGGTRIDDPFKQLSAVSLRTVLVIGVTIGRKNLRLLRRLRLKVEWYYVECDNYTHKLFTAIDFKSLRLSSGGTTIEDFASIGVKNFHELYFDSGQVTSDIRCFHAACRSLFPHVDKLTVCVDKNSTDFLVYQFLKFANEEYESLKSVKILNFYSKIPNLRMYNAKLNYPGFIYLYGFDLRLSSWHQLEFYKYHLEEGMAIVVKNAFHVYIAEKETREALFEVIWEWFFPSFPSEDVYNHFLNAASDSDAVHLLRKVSAPLVEYSSDPVWKPIWKPEKYIVGN